VVNGTSAGGQSLTVLAGTGSIAVTGRIGATVPLGGLALNAGSIVVDGPMTTQNAAESGAMILTAGTIDLNTGITTIGGAISLNGAVVLGSDPMIDTTNGGADPAGANITIGTGQ